MIKPLQKMRGFHEPSPNVTPMLERVPPHDAEAEASVLGAMMIDERATAIACEELTDADFYIGRHALLFTEVRRMFSEGTALEETVIRNELKRLGKLADVGGQDQLSRMITETGSAASIETYCKIVKELSTQRKLLTAAGRIIQAVEEPEGKSSQQVLAATIAGLIKIEEPIGQSASPDQLLAQIEAEIAGTRSAMRLPQRAAMLSTKCFLPGTITVFCGTAGASKSLFTLEMIWQFYFDNINIAKLELESGVTFHLRRAVAQMSKQSQVTNDDWTRENPERARETFASYKKEMDEIVGRGVLQAPPEGKPVDCALLLRWISQEADKGRRLLAIDPITLMETTDKCWIDQANFVRGARALVDKKQISLWIVAHPRSTPGQITAPCLENLAGSSLFQKSTDTIFWLQAHDLESAAFRNPFEADKMCNENYNRTLHILKCRLGPGSGKKIAYKMESETLRHIERGFLE